jgi:hypothetical protein
MIDDKMAPKVIDDSGQPRPEQASQQLQQWQIGVVAQPGQREAPGGHSLVTEGPPRAPGITRSIPPLSVS